MTKLEEFLVSLCSKETETGLPNYESMSPAQRQAIDNLKKAVEETLEVFSIHE